MKNQIILSDKAIIKIDEISEELNKYGSDFFEELYNLKPQNKGFIICSGQDKIVSRYHKSYMTTPSYDPKIFKDKNYMFSGKEEINTYVDLPELLVPYLTFVNKINNCQYNQVTVNWFEDGDSFIPQHSDCEVNKKPGSNVSIISIGGNRIFRINSVARFRKESIYNNIDIICRHGTLIIMDGEDIQKKFNHGIPKINYDNKRISISFREYENP